MWNQLTILWNDLTMERNDRGYSHAPSRLPMNKLKSLLQKTRKVTLFVWKSIRKNTPLRQYCRLRFIVTLKIEKVYT